MLNATAKHNEVNSMKYLQQKLISHKDDNMLNDTLEYAIKSQSFDTTLHLMQQKIKLSSSSQKELLGILHKDEYEIFYKKISSNDTMLLPSYSKEDIVKKKKMAKKTFSLYECDISDYALLYDYLTTIIHNCMVELYAKHIIDDFDLSLYSNKAHVTTYSKTYPIDFMKEFESSLYANGFDRWSDDFISLYDIKENRNKNDIMKFTDMINDFVYKESFSIYDFIDIEIM